MHCATSSCRQTEERRGRREARELMLVSNSGLGSLCLEDSDVEESGTTEPGPTLNIERKRGKRQSVIEEDLVSLDSLGFGPSEVRV